MAAAVAAGASTYLHWLPCRGALLSGSVVRAYRYGPDFSDACLRRMNGSIFPLLPEPAEQTPWASDLGVVAMSLAATAWLVLVVGMRWPLRTKAVAAVPGLMSLALAASLAHTARPADEHLPVWLLLPPEVAALVTMVALVAWQPELDERELVRVLVVAWGSTAFGAVHLVIDYAFMFAFSDANWDTPPLTGSVTVATLFLAAVVTLRMTFPSSRASRITRELPHAAHPCR